MIDLPTGWASVRLDEVAQVQLGRQRSPKNHSGERMRPYVRAANLTWNGLDLSDVKEMNFSESESSTYELQTGDVLVSEASGSPDEVGKPVVWRGEIDGCCFQNTVVRVRSRGPLPEYMRYYLLGEARSGRIGRASPGVGIHHIGAARLSAWPVPLPPLAEQRRIVAAIEEQFSRLDVAEREGLSAAIKLGGLRRAVVDALSSPDWPSVKLIDVVDVLDSKRVPVNAKERALRPGDVPYYGATGQVGWIDRPLFDEELVLLGEDGAPFFDQSKPKAYVIDGPSWVNNHAHVLRARSNVVISQFLKFALDRVDYRPLVTGTTRGKLTQAAMRQISLQIPDLAAQRDSLEHLQHQLSLIDSLYATVESAQKRNAALRRAILERTFRGELVPQDPNDEPASALLARIRAERAAAPPERRARTARAGR